MRYIAGFAVLLALSAPAYAGMAYFKYDYLSGTDRICVYEYLGKEHRVTVRTYETCPPTYEVPD